MTKEEFKKRVLDEEHLRLLAVFHYVLGGLSIALSLMLSMHLVMMTTFAANPEFFNQGKSEISQPFPASEIFGIFAIVIGIFMFLGITFGILQIMSGRFLKQKKRKLFSIIVAIPNLIFIPFGTILAILTLIVLERESIGTLYEEQKLEFEIVPRQAP